MQKYLSFELFVHYKGLYLVDCESITKYVCLKSDAFACNRRLKCSDAASENYPGWKECAKVAFCLNAIRRNTLQIINNKNHQKRKKAKKWREDQMMLNPLFTALRGDFVNNS